MTRTQVRTAKKVHECGCRARIRPGDRYLEHVAAPDHGDLGNLGWWRLQECAACARRYGRGALIDGDVSDAAL